MLDQHLQIIEQDVPAQQKISELFMLCEHLYRVLDKTEESQRDLRFIESVCQWRKEEGFRLKVKSDAEGFRAVFWRFNGGKIESYSHTSTDIAEAISRAGNQVGADKIIAKIRAWREEMGIDDTEIKT